MCLTFLSVRWFRSLKDNDCGDHLVGSDKTRLPVTVMNFTPLGFTTQRLKFDMACPLNYENLSSVPLKANELLYIINSRTCQKLSKGIGDKSQFCIFFIAIYTFL